MEDNEARKKDGEAEGQTKVDIEVTPSVDYEVIVRDKDGNVIQRQKGPSRSYLKAYNQLLLALMSRVARTFADTSGVNRTCEAFSTYALRVLAVAGNISWGTRVGAGLTAVDISDYALETPIAHGVGAGQLDHLAVTVSTPTVTATESAYTVKRIFLNKSGGTIVVTEIGMYCIGRGIAPPYYFCIVRDVLGVPVVIPDGGAITVIYSFKAVA
ncbi:hypothetical protein ES703_104491 [subsurface metagenome]